MGSLYSVLFDESAGLIGQIIGLLPIAAMIGQTLFVNGTFSLDA